MLLLQLFYPTNSSPAMYVPTVIAARMLPAVSEGAQLYEYVIINIALAWS